MSIKITALVENQAYAPQKIQISGHAAGKLSAEPSDQLKAEFGLSLYIETEERAILFDAGRNGGFLDNARFLSLPAENVPTVILSHGHVDHARGLIRFSKEAGTPFTLYLHKDSFRERYWFHEEEGGYYQPTGSGLSPEWLIREGIDARVIAPNPLFRLSGSIFLMGSVPRISPWEPIDSRDRIRVGDALLPDPYTDEMTMIIEQQEGLVLITGCAHTGLINLCTQAEKLFGKPVHYYIGGTHLLPWGPERTIATIDYINQSQIKAVAPCHCTGSAALQLFAGKCHAYVPFGGGITLEIP